jgi:hypothetical protein
MAAFSSGRARIANAALRIIYQRDWRRTLRFCAANRRCRARSGMRRGFLSCSPAAILSEPSRENVIGNFPDKTP